MYGEDKQSKDFSTNLKVKNKSPLEQYILEFFPFFSRPEPSPGVLKVCFEVLSLNLFFIFKKCARY